jgi:hypothetical protein
MDIKSALDDIDDVLASASKESASGTQATTLLHACVSRYSPPGSTYRTEADNAIKAGAIARTSMLKGVLHALRTDVEKGRLARFEETLHADVYSDLLSQAEGLQNEGFSRAATVIAGAALEEHVRLLATKHGIPTLYNGKPKQSSMMNNELRGAAIYTDAQRTIVEGWQKLRNIAAHGQPGFDGTNTSHVGNVAPMIDGIRGFIVQYPA